MLPSSEARSHGVGYFKFSKDEEQRQEQLSVLNKLRQQVCVHAHTPGLFVSTPIHLDYVCVHTHTPGLCLCPRPHTWTVFCVGFNCSTCVYVCGAIDWQPEEAKRGDQREEKGIAGNKTS